MRREELEHLLRAVGTILHDNEVIVVGSQAILGTFDESVLPADVVLSVEADFLPLHDPDSTKADLIDGVLGEDSTFHEAFGVYAQGVDETTSILPAGWRDRLVRYENVNTNGVVGWCLEIHDLCAAKLIANRPKDHAFVKALLSACVVQATDVNKRLAETPCDDQRRATAVSFLAAQPDPTPRSFPR